MTLRNEVDGWTRDIYGTYWFGAWRFVFRQSEYPTGFRFKFRLDDNEWQEGDDLVIEAPRDEHLERIA